MFPNPNLPRSHDDRDELYNTSTISEDLSKGGSVGPLFPKFPAFEEYVASPRPQLSYIPNPRTRQEAQNNTDYSFQLMLLEQQNQRRKMMEPSKIESGVPITAQPGVSSYIESPPMLPRLSPLVSSSGPYQFPQPMLHRSTQPYQATSATPNTRNSYHSNASGQKVWTPSSTQETVSFSEANDLKAQITALQEKVRQLEGRPVATKASKYQILYRIEKDETYPNDDYYSVDSGDEQPNPRRIFRRRPRTGWMGIFTDPPEVYQRSMGAPNLRCNDPLTNFELYLALNQDISFVVFRNFKRHIARQSHNTKYGKPEPFSETIYPVSDDLKEVVQGFLGGEEFQSMREDYEQTGEVQSPYLFIYHNRGSKEAELRRGLTSEMQTQMDLLLNYVQETRSAEYAAADSLLKRGKICPEFVQYLFRPDEVLVSTKYNEHTGYVATDWPAKGVQTHNTKNASTWTILAQTWQFDGQFHKSHQLLEFQMPEPKRPKDKKRSQRVEHPINDSGFILPDIECDKEVTITDLAVFPIRYASPALVLKLENRGKIFWKFRTQQYVSYKATEEENFQTVTNDRYIIDMKTYKRLHASQNPPVPLVPGSALDSRAMASEQPPDKLFTLLMPPRVLGFNLRRKKWFDLAVDRIVDVVWNKDAFSRLAIDTKSRYLIEALVTNHLEPDYSADLIAGKGNGLILLLHGGPGTGKTLTAESVAEIAERPLYRVTCGDVGTKPEEVEKYLESVLHLGKIWNCVVLLDEADVFLEQRGLEDLNRNALVSAFLRVVEYFEGILILTTNRVGTFDDAFKSRIQLALHYPPLREEQRRLIWKTFIERLDEFDEESISYENLRGSLDVLKKEKLNGRQIRNAMTTSRQYAKWKNELLTYEHLKDVIEVSARFEDYLENIHRSPHTQG